MKTISPFEGLRIIDARVDIREHVSKSVAPEARPWGRRKLSDIKILAVHHRGPPVVDEDADGWKVIQSDAIYHVQKNWGESVGKDWYAPSIAYHYVITREGFIYWLNDRGAITWHAHAANRTALSVQLQGNMETQEPTTKQLHSLQTLLNYLTTPLNINGYVLDVSHGQVWGHGELTQYGNATACPGNKLLPYVQEYRAIGRIQKAAVSEPPEHPAGFTDIEKGSWYEPFAKACIDSGIMRGYPDGTWRPSQPVTRAEMAKIIIGSAMHSERLIEAYKNHKT